MAKLLSKEQKNINADLVAIGGKAFTEIEFREKDINAKKLEDMKNGTYISALTDSFEAAFEYETFLHTVAKLRPTNTMESLSDLIINAAHTSSTKALEDILNQINTRIGELGLQTDAVVEIIKECKAQPLPISEAFETALKEKLENAKDINATIIKQATAKALGINHQPLIDKIADSAYLLTWMGYACTECGHTESTNKLKAKIDAWVAYCHMTDNTISSMKINFPTWEKMSIKQKNSHIKSWKSLAKVANMPELHVLIHFVENYGMNQGVLAKAEALLVQQLPNITTLETAKAVTIHTSLNKSQ